MAIWPASLPQSPLASGYAAEPVDAVLRSPMDTGPDKTRLRFTAVPELLTCSVLMTAAQRTTFLTFFEQTLLRGALPFDWVHPETGAAISCTIKGVPKRSSRPPNFIITLTIEVLP